MREIGTPEPHTILVAYKASEWVLIDSELIDLNQLRQWFPRDSSPPLSKNSNAMLCLLQNQKSHQTIVVANCHLEHKPQVDHVKYAQAVYLIEKAAKYVRDNGGVPFICGGDFNSLPVSSVLTAFYGENIEGS